MTEEMKIKMTTESDTRTSMITIPRVKSGDWCWLCKESLMTGWKYCPYCGRKV